MTAPIQMPAASTADTDQGEEAGQGAGLATSRPAPDSLIALAREGRIAVVPVEATDEMAAAWPAYNKGAGHERSIYNAMLSASPTLTPALLALAEERERLREALAEIIKADTHLAWTGGAVPEPSHDEFGACAEIARRALTGDTP